MSFQKLNVGLHGNCPGIERILSQEALEFSQIDFSRKISPEDFAVVIIADAISGPQIQMLKEYISLGGSALILPQSANFIFPELKISKTRINYISGEGKLFNKAGLLWLEMDGHKIEGAQHGKINGRNENAVFSGNLEKGNYIILPFDPNAATLNEESACRAFSSPYSKCADEQVSKVAKGNVRQLFLNCIAWLFSMRNLPYVHLWYYPDCKKSVFMFRIDLDKWDLEHIRTTLKVALDNQITMTWFMNTDDSEKFGTGILAEIKNSGQEMQSHAHKHFIYPTYEENKKNIRDAEQVLSKIGIKPTAFVSPFGHWNQSLGESLEDLDYRYSIQALLDTDNFPFHPIIRGKPSEMLNIPNHSMCIYRLAVYDYTDEMMVSYFRKVINQKYSASFPIMLYGHPTKELGLHPNVLDFIFKYVKTLPNLWISSLDKFFKWWSLRENAAVSAHLDAGNLNFQVKNIFPHLCIRIVLPDDRELIVPAEEESKISLTRAHIESKPFKTASIDDFEPHLSQIRLSKRIIHFFVMKVKRILGKAD